MGGMFLPAATALLSMIAARPAGAEALQEPEPEAVRVTGRVIDAADGRPLAGAVVVLEGTDFRVETDADGRFELNRVARGAYRLRLSHPGYEPKADDFPVMRDGGVVVVMRPLAVEDDNLVTGIMGTLTASTDGSPLVGAAVRVDSGRRGVLTDDRGNFMVDELAPGPHVVEFAQIGYATRRDTVRVLPGRVTTVEASLSADPVRLDPLKVVVERREAALQDAGFYERRARGFGRFMDRELIEMRAPVEMTDLFAGLTGVTVETIGTSRRVVLRSGRVGLSDGYCYPRVFLDNILVHEGGGVAAGIDDLVNPDAVAGLEIYPSSAGLPARYASMSAGCGLILIWTRS